MSWDSYLDTLHGYGVDKNGESHLDFGCIIGMNGAIWTTNAHAKALKIAPDQAAALAKAFTDKKFDQFQSGGFKVAEVPYMYLRFEDYGESYALFGKKKELGSIVLQNTKSAIVIGHCPEGQQQGNCSVAVNKVCEYLASVGY